MQYCENCNTEYVQEMAFCPDCGGKLIGEQEFKQHLLEQDQQRTKLQGIKMTMACPVNGRVEALQMQGILEQEDIPVFIRTFEETAYDGLFVSQKGWGEIWVAESRLEDAMPIIEELKKNPPPELPEDPTAE
jgi:hypothetical protein